MREYNTVKLKNSLFEINFHLYLKNDNLQLFYHLWMKYVSKVKLQ